MAAIDPHFAYRFFQPHNDATTLGSVSNVTEAQCARPQTSVLKTVTDELDTNSTNITITTPTTVDKGEHFTSFTSYKYNILLGSEELLSNL